MWTKNPFQKGGWCGKDGDWYSSGWCNYQMWHIEKEKGAYRWVPSVHNFVENPHIHFFSQKAMFHGAIPNPGFPPLSFFPSS
ncbi:MAG: hypothetical protein GXO44_00075 [Deferribacteres bacterium]|nr:hypothetical protein [Deferribacteres bacterium]